MGTSRAAGALTGTGARPRRPAGVPSPRPSDVGGAGLGGPPRPWSVLESGRPLTRVPPWALLGPCPAASRELRGFWQPKAELGEFEASEPGP